MKREINGRIKREKERKKLKSKAMIESAPSAGSDLLNSQNYYTTFDSTIAIWQYLRMRGKLNQINMTFDLTTPTWQYLSMRGELSALRRVNFLHE